MLHVLLLILKIIGIIIAVLLGLVVLIAAAVLFVPIRYSAKATYYNNVPTAEAKVSWLCHLLRIKAVFCPKEGFQTQIKILFFRLKPREKKKSKATSSDSIFEESSKDAYNPLEEDHFNKEEDFYNENVDADNDEVKTQAFFEHSREGLSEQEEKEDVIEDKKSKKNVIRLIIQKIVEWIQKLIQFFDRLKSVKENLSEKIQKSLDMINNPNNRKMVAFLWEQTKKLLCILKPKKFALYAHFGFKNPDITGKIAMYAAVLYGIIGQELKLYPDFDREVIEGEIYMKGSIQLFPITLIALKVYRNEQVKKYIKKKSAKR